MISLGEHIEYLLSRHDCIIVPELGAFIARTVEASWNDDYTVMSPPSRQLTFNPSLDHNDGLLANSVMRRHGLSYDRAMASISDEVSTLRHQIDNDGEAVIERVGIFQKSIDSTTTFSPIDNGLFNATHRALPVVNAKRIDRVKVDEPIIASTTITGKVPLTVRLRHHAMRVAASIALLICLGAVISTPILIDDSNVSKASMASAASSSISIERQSEPQSKPCRITLSIAIPDLASSTAVADTVKTNRYRARLQNRLKQTPISKSTKAISLRNNDTDNYCLVVASLGSRSEAEKYMSKHPYQSMKLLEQDGKFRVYVATATSSTELKNQGRAAGIYSRYPGAWVCTRHQ